MVVIFWFLINSVASIRCYAFIVYICSVLVVFVIVLCYGLAWLAYKVCCWDLIVLFVSLFYTCYVYFVLIILDVVVCVLFVR